MYWHETWYDSRSKSKKEARLKAKKEFGVLSNLMDVMEKNIMLNIFQVFYVVRLSYCDVRLVEVSESWPERTPLLLIYKPTSLWFTTTNKAPPKHALSRWCLFGFIILELNSNFFWTKCLFGVHELWYYIR